MSDLINQLPCGIFLVNEAGVFVLINATAEQHLGYGPGELLGRPFRQVLTLASQMFYQTHVYPLINLHKRVDEVALTLQTRTGERIPILLNAVRQQQENDWVTHCVYLSLGQRHHYEAELIQARNVAEQAQMAVQESETKYRALAEELETHVIERTKELSVANTNLLQVNTDLKRSNKNLEQFAYIASHDLQEPLRKIQQFGDLLISQYATSLGDGVNYLERMQVAARRMSTLIRDLLAFSRISTRQEISDSVFLADIVNTVVADLDLRIQEAEAVVTVTHLPTVQGDPAQLAQLFQNLLTNGLKFRRAEVAPKIEINSQAIAAIDLPAGIRPTRLATNYHRIDVVDNGIGFDEKYLDRIFQVFQRLHGKSEYAGTGVGLAICEKVAANHGGAITATSQPGQGATFSIYLPV